MKKTEDIICSILSHFWSTSRSPFSTFYIPFQSLGSQESNASNGARFGVETKELQPLQADHSKLKEEFCTTLRNHPFVARWFHSLFVQCCGFPPEVSHHYGSRIPQAKRPLRNVAKSVISYEPFKGSLRWITIDEIHYHLFCYFKGLKLDLLNPYRFGKQASS